MVGWAVSRARAGPSFAFVSAVMIWTFLCAGMARADALPEDACGTSAHEGDPCGNAGPFNVTPGTCHSVLCDRASFTWEDAHRASLLCVCVGSADAHGWRIFPYPLAGTGVFAVGLGALAVARRGR